MSDVVVRNALISVYYKGGIVEMAQKLAGAGVNIYSTGGTAKVLEANDIDVVDVSDYTKAPEMMGGRVKTLHPKVHGGILYRRDNLEDSLEANSHGIVGIDLVVVNLYPVQEAISGGSMDEVVLKTDVGGHTLIRAAAKNHKDVVVVVNPNDYDRVGDMVLNKGVVGYADRVELALKAFRTTRDYDAAIAKFYEKFSWRV
jgi:phosphoribosylaminoimidazolecarboxamide formyltransferase / IMP cyclohydrolase